MLVFYRCVFGVRIWIIINSNKSQSPSKAATKFQTRKLAGYVAYLEHGALARIQPEFIWGLNKPAPSSRSPEFCSPAVGRQQGTEFGRSTRWCWFVSLSNKLCLQPPGLQQNITFKNGYPLNKLWKLNWWNISRTKKSLEMKCYFRNVPVLCWFSMGSV